jgi:hypothetical protein
MVRKLLKRHPKSEDVMFYTIQALTLIMGENAICGLPGNVDEE